jgi:hypothetical protein
MISAGGRDEAEPSDRFVAGQAGFAHGRQVGHRIEPFFGRHREHLDPFRLNEGNRGWDVGDGERDVAGQEVLRCRACPAIRHERHVDAGQMGEQLRVRCIAGPLPPWPIAIALGCCLARAITSLTALGSKFGAAARMNGVLARPLIGASSVKGSYVGHLLLEAEIDRKPAPIPIV